MNEYQIITHFLIPDCDKLTPTCGQEFDTASDVLSMVDCPKCLKLIEDGAPTVSINPYHYGEKELYVGSIIDPTKEWPEDTDYDHDGTYDLEEGLELLSDEWIMDDNCSKATIISLRENCKRLLARVNELESNG